MTEQTPTVEDVAQRLAEMEKLAIETGDRVQIDPPEFTANPTQLLNAWNPFWIGQEVPPVMARATVHRNGIPTTVYVSWDESVPAAEDWRTLWEHRPMKLFGAYALRAALRRAFRDVIGEQREPDEKPAPGEPGAERVEAPKRSAQDEHEHWESMLLAAVNVELIDEYWAYAREERARTGALEKIYRERRAELVAAGGRISKMDTAAEWEPAPSTAQRAALDQLEASTASARRQPQDHKPPQNRAARRQSKRGRRS